MRKVILILTQTNNNESIRLLRASLEKQDQFNVLSYEISQITLVNEHLVINESNHIFTILLKDISLIIKRTWGPMRTQALELCQTLTDQHVTILNGCDFIRWSHSKVAQYESLKHLNLIPESMVINLDDEIDIGAQLDLLGFPLIIKKDQGCRADGVYLVANQSEFNQLISDLKKEGSERSVLIQKYIPNVSDPSVSSYYRINVVAKKAQSAVQFQLKWVAHDHKSYKTLGNLDSPDDKAVPLSFFDRVQLQAIINACPYTMDVVGLDVMISEGKLWLLEFNDGPNIDLTVNLGKKLTSDLDTSIQSQQFSDAIAQHCFSLAKYTQLNELTVIEYLRQLPLFSNRITADIKAHEVGDGNLNYVYIVGPLVDGSKIVVKQAVPYLRCKPTWILSRERMLYESKSLKLFHSLVPEHVPDIYHVDHEMSLIVMQYLDHHIIMRKGLMAQTEYPHFVDHITTFMAEMLFKTSSHYLSGEEKRKIMADYVGNHELCKITEDLVFTVPYMNHDTNPPNLALQDDIALLQTNDCLKKSVLVLKNKFMTKADALLHGDLHTGSVMVNEIETFVIDSEFAFFGPIGFDVGTLLAELILSWISHVISSQHQQYQDYLLQTIEDVFTSFKQKFIALWNAQNNGSGLVTQGFFGVDRMLIYQQDYFKAILEDTIGFAGIVITRRIVGLAGVADIRDIQDSEKRLACEQLALRIATRLVLERQQMPSIKSLCSVLLQEHTRFEELLSSRLMSTV